MNVSLLPPGVRYFGDFLSAGEEEGIAARLDAGEWSDALKRRVQHFGYVYDYKARTVAADAYLGKLPEWLDVFAERLVSLGYFEDVPDQVIANEYRPGQGISAHVDCVPCFSDTIISVSLLSQCEMIFRKRHGDEALAVLLHPPVGRIADGSRPLCLDPRNSRAKIGYREWSEGRPGQKDFPDVSEGHSYLLKFLNAAAETPRGERHEAGRSTIRRIAGDDGA